MPDLTVSPVTQQLTVSPSGVTVTNATIYTPDRFDPSVAAELYSDFTCDLSPFSVCTGTQGNQGSSSYGFNDPVFPGYGVLNLNCVGQQGARVGVYATETDGVAIVERTRTYGGGCAYDWKARVRFQIGLQYQRAICGLALTHGPPSTTLIVDTGAAFVARGSSSNWACVIASANVMTEVATAYSVDTMRTLRITIDAAGTVVRFFIDGVLVHSAAPAWDQNTLLAWGIEVRDKATGGSGSAAIMDVDYMWLKATSAR